MEKGHKKKKKKVISFPINYGDVIEQNKSSLITNKTQTRPSSTHHSCRTSCFARVTAVLLLCYKYNTSSQTQTESQVFWNSSNGLQKSNRECNSGRNSSNAKGNPFVERWAWYCDTHHQESWFLGDVEALFWALSFDHCSRWWSF